MKIGIVSSWNSKCGISEYSRNLVEGLIEKGIDIKVCANYNPDPVLPDESYVKRLFHTPFMTNETTADVPQMFEFLKDRDVVHFQFETSLYHSSWFSQLLRLLRANKPLADSPGTKIVFTMHSSGIWEGFDCSLVDLFVTHEPMWCSQSVIPMGVRFFENSIKPEKLIVSFGLGRNNDDVLKEAMKSFPDYDYRTSYGNHKWLSQKELSEFLSTSSIISLYYPEVGADVSSSAIMFALGIDRPILITPTKWFKHVINYPGLYICNNIHELKENISYLLDPSNKNEIQLEVEHRKRLLIEDGRTFEKYIKRHLNVYKAFA